MAELDGNSLMMDWYNTYVAPRKKPIEGVFTQDKPDFSLGIPSVPRVATAAPAQVPDVPAPPAENPLTDYTPQQPTASAPVEGEKESGGISPGAMGLLGAGFSMMATPPRAVPYSNMEIFGRGGQAGLAMYEKALEDKRRQQALDVSAEEHRLTREDQRIYRQGLLSDKEVQRKIQEQNAESLAKIREASGTAKTGKLVPVKQDDGTIVYERMLDAVGKEVPQKPKPSAWREVNFNGKNQWVDLNSPEAQDLAKQGAFGVKDKPGYAYFVADDGSIREIQKGAPEGTPPKVVAPKGTGKTSKPGGAGGPKQFEYQDQQAKASLVQKGIPEPTIEQIAQERQKLFPKGTTKANARNPRAMMAPTNAHEYLKQATDLDSARERVRKMKAAGYTRQQVEEALKGTPWQ